MASGGPHAPWDQPRPFKPEFMAGGFVPVCPKTDSMAKIRGVVLAAKCSKPTTGRPRIAVSSQRFPARRAIIAVVLHIGAPW